MTNSKRSEAVNWHKDLYSACTDLASNNSVDTFEEFLNKHADSLALNDLRDVRSRLVVAISNKTDHKLSGGALRAHALKCAHLAERVNELMKQRQEKFDPAIADIENSERISEAHKKAEKEREENQRKAEKEKAEQKRRENLPGVFKSVKVGKVELDLYIGYSKKGNEIVRIEEIHPKSEKSLTEGSTYSLNTRNIPKLLEDALGKLDIRATLAEEVKDKLASKAA